MVNSDDIINFNFPLYVYITITLFWMIYVSTRIVWILIRIKYSMKTNYTIFVILIPHSWLLHVYWQSDLFNSCLLFLNHVFYSIYYSYNIHMCCTLKWFLKRCIAYIGNDFDQEVVISYFIWNIKLRQYTRSIHPVSRQSIH